MPQFLYPRGKTPLHPLNRRLGEPLIRCGRFGDTFLALPAIKTRFLGFPARSVLHTPDPQMLRPDAMQIHVTILIFETKRVLQGLTS